MAELLTREAGRVVGVSLSRLPTCWSLFHVRAVVKPDRCLTQVHSNHCGLGLSHIAMAGSGD